MGWEISLQVLPEHVFRHRLPQRRGRRTPPVRDGRCHPVCPWLCQLVGAGAVSGSSCHSQEASLRHTFPRRVEGGSRSPAVALMAPLRFPVPDLSLNLVWGSHGNLRQDPVEKTGSPMLPAIQIWSSVDLETS